MSQVETSLAVLWLIYLMGWLRKILKCSDHKVLEGHSDWRYGADTAETPQSASLVSKFVTFILFYFLFFLIGLSHSIKLLQSLNVWNVRSSSTVQE